MNESNAGRGPQNEASTNRRFRLPAVSIGAAEYHIQTSRIVRGPIGVLAVLAGVVLIAAYRLFPESGGSLTLVGLVSFGLGQVLSRLGCCLGIVLAGLGTGAAVAGSMSLLGVKAALAYWSVAGFFFLAGVLLAGNLAAWPNFPYARREATRTGCRIGLFRPFHSKYSAQAKNLLLPLLRGYGDAYFVADESFDESEPAGGLGRDYERFPSRVGGHRYTHDEWQSRVSAEIKRLDVAIIDISIPSASLVWEIKQCIAQLPRHRILFVASVEEVFPPGLLPQYDQDKLRAALLAHIGPINKGLQEMGSNPISSRCLVYWPGGKGTEWLANALFQSMYSIVITEFGETPGPMPGTGSLHPAATKVSIRGYYAANKKRVRRMVLFEYFASPFSDRTRAELIEVVGDVRRRHLYYLKTPIVEVSVPVCRECWWRPKSRDGDKSQAADVPADNWQGGLMHCGLSEDEVADIEELLRGSHAHLFCHGECHRALVYGRDDVFVVVRPFDEYVSDLVRGTSGSQARKARKWIRHVVFEAFSGHCFGCYTPLDWESVELRRGPSPARLNEPIRLELLCHSCDEEKRAASPQFDKISVHFPLWPGSSASW